MIARKADLGDIGVLIDLGKLMTEESPVYSRFTPDYTKQYKVLVNMLMNPKCVVLVLDDLSGMLLGHVEDMPWFVESLAVEDILFVRKELRKTPRAPALIEAFTEWAKEQETVEMRMGITTEVNVESTLGFYEKMGFQFTGAFVRKGV